MRYMKMLDINETVKNFEVNLKLFAHTVKGETQDIKMAVAKMSFISSFPHDLS